MTPEEIKTLSARGQVLRAEIATREDELAKIEASFKALGKGRYGAALVVLQASGKPGYKMPKDGEDAARKLAGEEFGSLFDRKVIFTPCAAFEVVAPKLLTPAKARDLVALCTVPGKAGSQYVKWD